MDNEQKKQGRVAVCHHRGLEHSVEADLTHNITVWWPSEMQPTEIDTIKESLFLLLHWLVSRAIEIPKCIVCCDVSFYV